MKKALKIGIPILLIASCIIALATFYIKNLGDNDEYAKFCSLNLMRTTISKNVGDKFNIIDTCGVRYDAGENQKPYFKSENHSVLSVNATSGNAECLSKGNVKVFVMLKVGEEDVLKKEVVVNIGERTVYPENADLEKSCVMLLKGESAQNKLIIDKMANSLVFVYYEKGLVTYDYKTGKVISKGEVGEDTVFIEIGKSKTEKIRLQFKVIVSDKNEINIEKTVLTNQTIKISYQNSLKTTTSNLFMSEPVLSNDNVVIDNQASDYGFIIIKAIGAGECIIKFNDGINFVVIKVIVQ